MGELAGAGVLPYILSRMSMCHCEGFGFQAVYSGIGYRNQTVFVYREKFTRKEASVNLV